MTNIQTYQQSRLDVIEKPLHGGARHPISRTRLLTSAAIAAVAACATAVGQSVVDFPAPQTPLPLSATCIAAGDLNLDGRSDVVAGIQGAFCTVLADSQGKLTSLSSTLIDQTPAAIVALDINNDGVPDILASSVATSALKISYGIGGGAFAPYIVTLTAPGAGGGGLVVDDFNGDGTLDIVVGAASSYPVFLAGFGFGYFGIPSALGGTFSGSTGAALAAEDINNDGRTDFIALHPSNGVIHQYNGGLNAAPTPTQQYSVVGPDGVSPARLDQDPWGDFVVTSSAGNQYYLLSGSPTGVLTISAGAPLPGQPRSPLAADFNLDGRDDLACPTPSLASGPSLTVSYSSSSGLLPPLVLHTGSLSIAAASGDLNADGSPDVILLGAADLTAFINNTASSIGPGLTLVPVAGSVRSIHAVDFTNDARADIACLTQSPNSLFIRVGNGLGDFPTAKQVALGSTSSDSTLGDFNTDGIPDFVATNSNSSIDVSVITSTGSQFGETWTATSTPLLGATSVACGDISLDGKLDFVIAGSSNGVLPFLGNGLGSFTKALPSAYPAGLVDCQLADVNHDGMLDVVAVSGLNKRLAIFLNVGGVIGPLQADIPLPLAPGQVVLSDVNSNGKLDAVIYSTPSLLLLLDGSPYFGLPIVIPTQQFAKDISVADVSGDGNPDLITTEGTSLAIRPGSISGAFLAPSRFSAAAGGGLLSVNLVNTDPAPDIVVSSNSGATLHLNQLVPYPDPNGTLPFGAGTAGCSGTQPLNANKSPSIGQTTFQICTSHCPPASAGLWMIGDSKLDPGIDTFLVGAALHINIPGSTEFYYANSLSDGNGNACLSVPVPNLPGIIGKVYFAQSLWVWPINVCFNFPYGISTSNGLAITIQP